MPWVKKEHIKVRRDYGKKPVLVRDEAGQREYAKDRARK